MTLMQLNLWTGHNSNLSIQLDCVKVFHCIQIYLNISFYKTNTATVIYSISLSLSLSFIIPLPLSPAGGLGVWEDADGEGQQPRRDPEAS